MWRVHVPEYCEDVDLGGFVRTDKRLFVCFRSDNKVTVHFINRDGETITAKGSPGDSLLDVVINEDLDFDGFGRPTSHSAPRRPPAL